jgi:hypothetical protein
MQMKIKDLYEQIRDGKIISDIELQREIIYSVDKQELVIDSVLTDVPLPAFYFWKNDVGIYEVLDGKQRIEAIKKFIENDIQYKNRLWKQLDATEQEQINDSEITVIVCEGEEDHKREIFRRINTLGVPLSPYEVLNGLYSGEYLRGLSAFVEQDKYARSIFTPNSRGANQIRILKHLKKLKGFNDISTYVKQEQNNSFQDDQRAIEKYYRFIYEVFSPYKDLDILFNLSLKYLSDKSVWKEKKREINAALIAYRKSTEYKLTDHENEIEDRIQAIVNNISVDAKRLFTSDDKDLYLSDKEEFDEKYQCEICHQWFFPSELEMDHIVAWSKGGRTVLSNAQALCRSCNSKKGNR